MSKSIMSGNIMALALLFVLAVAETVLANEYERSFNEIPVSPFGHNDKEVAGSDVTGVFSGKAGNIYTLAEVKNKGFYLLFLSSTSEKWQIFKLQIGGRLEPADEFSDKSSPPLLIATYGATIKLCFIGHDGKGNLNFPYKDVPCGVEAKHVFFNREQYIKVICR